MASSNLDDVYEPLDYRIFRKVFSQQEELILAE